MEQINNEFAIVRKELALLDLVSRTWFEWEMETDHFIRVLVVEVACDTDPNSVRCDRHGIEGIAETAKRVLTDQSGMIVTKLRIVPKQPQQFSPPTLSLS